MVRNLVSFVARRHNTRASFFAAAAEIWAPTHKHKKGGLYRFLSKGILETDRSSVVIYDDAEGVIWVRPMAEFQDGRFLPL